MRELIDAFFRERSIVNHHIASFNDFLPTIDNPNSRMQRIVDNLRSSPEDERRGIIKLDEDRTEGDVIEIRIGRKRDDRGRIDLEAKPTITLGLPVVKEANGATHPLNPMEARLRNLNYTAPIYLDFTVIENGIEREPERVHIGNFPIMVKSKRCLLYKENMENEGELTIDEYRRKLIEDTQEDPFDPGAYFIIGGTERALISLEDLAPNRVLVEFNERYGRKVEVAKVFSQKEGYRALTLMEKKKDGQLIVSVPTASGQIPLIILMKALGMEKDEEIYNAVVSVPGAKGAPKAMKASVDQHGCKFVPHVTAMTPGEVELKNSDDILHNIHTYSTANPSINKAQPKFKKEMVEKLEKPELIKVQCDAHSWMHGWIVVTESPAALTDDKGSFKLENVPPGKHKVEVLHPVLGKQTKEVEVKAGQEARVSFELAAKK